MRSRGIIAGVLAGLLGLLLCASPALAASTYTTNLNLEKPARGAVDWDVKLNADLDLIDAAIPARQQQAASYGVHCNATDADAAHLQDAFDALAPGVKVSLAGAGGNTGCLVATTVNTPTTQQGFNLDFGPGGQPYAAGFGPNLSWNGAANGTVFSSAGPRYTEFTNLRVDGNGTAGVGIKIVDDGVNVASNFTMWQPHVTYVAGTPGYGFQFGAGDSTPGMCCVSAFNLVSNYNTVGVYADNGGGQDYSFYSSNVTGNSQYGFWNHYGAGPSNWFGGSWSANPVHFKLDAGDVNVFGTTFECSALLNRANIDGMNTNFFGAAHNCNDTSMPAVYFAGGQDWPTAVGSRFAGNFDCTNVSGGCVLVGNGFIKGGPITYGGGFNYVALLTGKEGLFLSGLYSQVQAPYRIMAYGSSAGSELLTDGNAEAADMTAWTSYNSPTTAEKVTTGALSGSRSIHIVSGSASGYHGVYRTFPVTRGHIYRVRATGQNVVSVGGQVGVFVGISTFEAGGLWDIATYTVGVDAIEKHEFFWEASDTGTANLWIVGKAATASEFLIDDLSIVEMTGGRALADHVIASSDLTVGGTTTTGIHVAASVADGGTITHGMGATPTGCLVTGTVAGEMVAVTARGGTTFTVAIKTPNPAAYGVTAGTTQDLTWQCAK